MTSEQREPETEGSSSEVPLAEAAAHVQEAVLAMVAAARSALDVVERLAKDPGPLFEAAGRAAAAGRQATGMANETAVADDDVEQPSGPTRRPKVEHIRVDPSP